MEEQHDRDVRTARRMFLERSTTNEESSSSDVTDDDESIAVAPQPQYGTFRRHPHETAPERHQFDSSLNERFCRWFNWFRIICSDFVLLFFVILFGLTATFAATYFSVKHVRDLNEFWSPCLHNISYSFVGL